MIDWFSTLPFALQAFFATCFTWGITALGASLVIFFKKINKNVMDAMLGFAAGVMTAASVWSLLIPSIEQSSSMGKFAFFPAFAGFWLGILFLLLLDRMIIICYCIIK